MMSKRLYELLFYKFLGVVYFYNMQERREEKKVAKNQSFINPY